MPLSPKLARLRRFSTFLVALDLRDSCPSSSASRRPPREVSERGAEPQPAAPMRGPVAGKLTIALSLVQKRLGHFIAP